MKTDIRLFFSVCILILVFTLRCTTDEIAGIEITNGECTGVIYDENFRKAADVVVRLIPAGYAPSATADSALVDSTMTDQEGRYTFTVPRNDFYNIIAEQGDASCMQDSVSLLVDRKNNLENDTLEGTGRLTGTIKVKTGNDPQAVIVLVLGTDRYTSPVDSTGTFPPLPLPAGTHTVRIFTSENGYAIIDTTVSIFSDDTTVLILQLPLSYAPAVNDFQVTYDSASLTAMLQWEPVDTALIRAYSIHRIVNGTEDSIIRIDRGDSGYTDNCEPFFDDTGRYEIAAVGTTFKEGYGVAGPAIQVCGKILSVEKIPFDNFTLDSEGFWKLCVDNDDNVYFHNYKDIYKVGTDGSILRHTTAKAITGSDGTVWMMSSDTRNNLLLYVQGEERSIYKLDGDFNVITSLTFPRGYVCVYKELSFTLGELTFVRFGENGTVYLHSTCDDSGMTTIREYDTDLVYKNSYTLQGYTYISYTSGDTVMATRLEGRFLHPEINPDVKDYSLTRQTGVLLDRSFNILASFETASVLDDATPYKCKLNVFALSDQYYLTSDETVRIFGDDPVYHYEEITGTVLSVFNRNGDCIGKHVFPEDFTFQFRDSKRLVGFSSATGPVLYKITINDLP
ncbi:MAG: hypothetical protein JW863_14045 [Chitinispirillaceae bacterium]|nr:hypothetical protein [Chitinispirillaceae bacterium]